MSKAIYSNQEFIQSFHEVDEAFAHKFSHIKVDGKPIRIVYATPDVDLFKNVELPAIAFYRNPPFRDVERWNNHHEIIDSPERNEQGNIIAVSKREFPEPWSLNYRLRTVYDLQEHGVQLNNQILRAIKRDDYITVKGYNYWIDLTRAKTFGEGGFDSKTFGQIKDGRRRFQESFDYRVDIWLEVDERRKVNTVLEIELGSYTFTNINEERVFYDGESKE